MLTGGNGRRDAVHADAVALAQDEVTDGNRTLRDMQPHSAMRPEPVDHVLPGVEQRGEDPRILSDAKAAATVARGDDKHPPLAIGFTETPSFGRALYARELWA